MFRAMRFAPILATAALLASAPEAWSQASTLTKTLVVDQLNGACFVTAPAGDYERLFVLQLNGRIRVLKQGQLLATAFLDIGVTGANKITSGGERGTRVMVRTPRISSTWVSGTPKASPPSEKVRHHGPSDEARRQ